MFVNIRSIVREHVHELLKRTFEPGKKCVKMQGPVFAKKNREQFANKFANVFANSRSLVFAKVWHNKLACLRGSPRATSEVDGDLWACPVCWAGATKRFGKRTGSSTQRRARRRTGSGRDGDFESDVTPLRRYVSPPPTPHSGDLRVTVTGSQFLWSSAATGCSLAAMDGGGV